MSITTDHVYTSSNGDSRHLIRALPPGGAVVRHTANLFIPAARLPIFTILEVFLRQAGSGPEFTALRRLLGSKLTAARYATHAEPFAAPPPIGARNAVAAVPLHGALWHMSRHPP